MVAKVQNIDIDHRSISNYPGNLQHSIRLEQSFGLC